MIRCRPSKRGLLFNWTLKVVVGIFTQTLLKHLMYLDSIALPECHGRALKPSGLRLFGRIWKKENVRLLYRQGALDNQGVTSRVEPLMF
jgi:hypothetical protein